MAHILNFDRQTQKYAVIERIGGGRWVERAQFAEMTNAGELTLFGGASTMARFSPPWVSRPWWSMATLIEVVAVCTKPWSRVPAPEQSTRACAAILIRE